MPTDTSVHVFKNVGGGNNESLMPPQPDAFGSNGDQNFWFELIGEKIAAAFVDLSVRSMQGYRYKGGGPRFCRLSARCVKYRRIDLRQWAEERLRTSTSDPGETA